MIDPLAQRPLNGLRKAFRSLHPSSTDADFDKWSQDLDDADESGEKMFAEFADVCNACLTAFMREGEPHLSEAEVHQIAYAEGHYDTKRWLLQRLARH